jgi:hypothetical protein
VRSSSLSSYGVNLLEALLTDLLLDLTDQYGNAFPRPAGLVLNFQVIAPNTTYAKAKKDIEALLTLYGLIPSNLTVMPGPEVSKPFNRSIRFGIAKDLLI